MSENTEVVELPQIDVEKTVKNIKESLIVPAVLEALFGKPPVIKNEQDKLKAVDELQQIKGEFKRLDADRKTFTDPIRKTIDAINARYKKTLDPLALAESVYKQSILAWDQAEEKRIKELNDKLEREAKEKQAKEAAKLEKQAQKALESGNEEKAQELQEKAAEVIQAPTNAPVVQPQKTSGISYKTVWSFQVEDAALIPREYLIIDQAKLDRLAQANDGNFNIPGGKCVSKQVMSSRSK